MVEITEEIDIMVGSCLKIITSKDRINGRLLSHKQ